MGKKAVETKQQKRVMGLVRRWKPILGLASWSIQVTFSEEESDCSNCRKTDGHTEWHTIMQNATDWAYMNTALVVFLPAIRDMSMEKLEEVVIHELCHTVVAEMRPDVDPQDYDTKHEERVVTMLAHSFLRTATYYEAKGQKLGGKKK